MSQRVVAELKSLFSSDFDIDDPPQIDLAVGDVWLQAEIGPQNADAREHFQFQVTSPERLATVIEADGPLLVRRIIVANYFHVPTIRSAIEELCSRTSGTDWSEVSQRLQRFAASEFEDYQPWTGQ